MRLIPVLALLAVSSLLTAAENTPVPQVEEEILQAAPVEEPPVADDGTDFILADVDEEDEDADSNRRFIPTEEISQDLGVSFPIDI